MTSVSATENLDNSFISSVLPVSLNPVESEDYQSFFFPKKVKEASKSKVASNLPERGDMFELVGELNTLANSICAAYSSFANVLTKFPLQNFDGYDINRKDETIQYLKNDSEYIKNSIEVYSDDKRMSYLNFISKGALFDQTKSRAENKKQHMPYIIQPSKVYPNGFDVMWVGSSGYSFGSSPLLGVHHDKAAMIAAKLFTPVGYHQRDSLDSNAAHPIGQSVMDSLIGFNDILTSGSGNDIEKCDSRNVTLLPLDFNFEQLNDLGYNKALGDNIFGKIKIVNLSSKFKKYKKYFSVLILTHPNSDLVYKMNTFKQQGLVLDKGTISKNAYIATPNISFSLVMHLPEHLAHYITQTPKGQNPPYTSMCQWLSLWSGDMFRKSGTAKSGRAVPYIIKPSTVVSISEKRKNANLYVEKGTIDENNLTISDKGTLIYCPKAEVLDSLSVNSAEHEKKSEEFLKFFFDAGFTPRFDTRDVDSMLLLESNQTRDTISEKIKTMASAQGTLLAGTWDYGKVIFSSAEPHKTSSLQISGVVPDPLIINNFLIKPFSDAINDLVGKPATSLSEASRDEDADPNDAGSRDSSQSINTHIINVYNYLYSKGKVKSFAELLSMAASALSIKSLTDPNVADLEESIYYSVITSELAEKQTNDSEGTKISKVIKCVLSNCGQNGTLSKMLRRENPSASWESLDLELKDHPKYYSNSSPLAQFKNVYSWLGGHIYYLALLEIKNVDFLTLFKQDSADNYPSARLLMTKVMPYVVTMTTYVPNSETIAKRAERLVERNTPNENIGIDDIKVPGTLPTAMLFPHQVKSHKKLRNKPRFAILDVQAGGGKCTVASTLVHTSRGILSMGELWEMGKGEADSEGFKPLRVGVIDHTDKRCVTDKVYRTQGKTLKVTLSDGTEIEGLPQHKLWGFFDEEYQFQRLDELRIGDALPKAKTTFSFGKTQVVDGFTVDEDFATLLGLLVAEGYFGGDPDSEKYSKNHLEFTNSNPKVLQLYTDSWDAVFGDSDSLVFKYDERKEKTVTGIHAHKSKHVLLVKELCVEGKSADRVVPKVIRQSPFHVQCAFLRAYFEGDGTIHLRDGKSNTKQRWEISASSLSKQLITEIKVMLENIGISCNVRSRLAWATNGSENQVEKEQYILTLDSHCGALDLFAENIGFISSKKRKRLKAALKHKEWKSENACQNTNDTVFGRANQFPVGALCEKVYSLLLEIAYSTTYITDQGHTKNYGANTLRKLGYTLDLKGINKDGWCSRFVVERLNDFMGNGPDSIVNRLYSCDRFTNILNELNEFTQYSWLTVSSIEEGEEQYVYDISVPGNHSYVCNNIYSHNTLTVLSDIACSLRESMAVSEVFKSLVICPDNLVKNWCEDVQKMCGSSWNMVPVTTGVSKRWPLDKLSKIISNAPVNTIVVAGLDFIFRAMSYNIVLGGEDFDCSLSSEFLRNFGFTYVAIDEAHRCKNTKSKTHRLVKQICTSSQVKYVRLASGTIIPNIPSDIVGLASMLNGGIFRSREEFENSVIDSVRKDASETEKFRFGYKKVKQRLNDNTAMISVKRKEWAFMLPSPIEQFIAVYLSYAEEEAAKQERNLAPSDIEGKISVVHRKIYEAVLKESVDELSDIMKKLSSEDGDDDELDDALDSAESTGKYRFSRLDRIAMDPRSDPLGAQMFDDLEAQGVDTSNFVPRKIKEIIKRLNLHYTDVQWTPGKYAAFDTVTYQNKPYVALRPQSDDGTFQSQLPPDRDLTRWKEEARGKVIILCQYTTSIEALYKALPENYKKITVKIYAGNSSPAVNDKNLQMFMKSESVKILIVQSSRIAEGFNLQVASRLIRAELPWTPGAIEQANARLFRPLPGSARREVVRIDTIVTNATLEVLKTAKLYSKTLDNCKYEEVDNTDGPNGTNRYVEILNLPTPEKPKLSKILLGTKTDSSGNSKYPLFSDYVEKYMVPYRTYCNIRNSEFEEMRKSGREQSMIKMITVDVPKEYKQLEYVPYMPRQAIADPHNFQFMNMEVYLEEEAHKKDKEALFTLMRDAKMSTTKKSSRWFKAANVGNLGKLKMHFEGGYGILDSIQLQYDPELPDQTPMVRVRIKSSNGVINTVDAYSAYVITNLDDQNLPIFKNSKPIFEEIVEKQTKIDTVINEGEDLDDSVEEVEDDTEISVTLIPVVYNEFLGLEVLADDSTQSSTVKTQLEKISPNFRTQGRYLILTIRDKKVLSATLKAIREKGYTMTAPCAQSIKSLVNSFDSETSKFVANVESTSNLRAFYARDHKGGTKDSLKIYPVVSNGKLALVVNCDTNKQFTRDFANSPIETITTQAKKAFRFKPGMEIMFVRDKKELYTLIARIIKSNLFTITNRSTIKSEFDALVIQRS